MEFKSVRDSNKVVKSAFSPVCRPHNVDDRSNLIKHQVSSHGSVYQDAGSNRCHFDTCSGYLKRLPVQKPHPPPTFAAVQDPGYVSLEWPSRANSYVSRSSVSSSVASTKNEASAAATSTPGVRNGQKDKTSKQNLHDDLTRQTTPPNCLHQSGGTSKRHQVGGLSKDFPRNVTDHHVTGSSGHCLSNPPNHHFVGSSHQLGSSLTRHFSALSHQDRPVPPPMSANGWSQENFDSQTKSRPDDIVRVHQPPSLTGVEQFGSIGCREQCRSDGIGDVVCNKARRSDEVRTVPVNCDVVSDLERRLAERDVELKTLRDTMERNELAMQRVLEDRKKVWETELAARRAEWQRTIDEHKEQYRHSDNVLRAQVARLERENQSLRKHGGGENVGRERELELELKTAHETVNRLTSELQLKQSELSDLRSINELRRTFPTAHPDVNAFTPPCACSVATGSRRPTTTSTNTKPSTEDHCITDKYIDNCVCRGPTSGDVTSSDAASRLRKELASVTSQLESARQEFDEERRQWTMEKEQVIAYQKHLQLNYVQMARRSAALHLEKQQLVSELCLLAPAKSCFLEGRQQTTYLEESHC